MPATFGTSASDASVVNDHTVPRVAPASFLASTRQ